MDASTTTLKQFLLKQPYYGQEMKSYLDDYFHNDPLNALNDIFGNFESIIFPVDSSTYDRNGFVCQLINWAKDSTQVVNIINHFPYVLQSHQLYLETSIKEKIYKLTSQEVFLITPQLVTYISNPANNISINDIFGVYNNPEKLRVLLDFLVSKDLVSFDNRLLDSLISSLLKTNDSVYVDLIKIYSVPLLHKSTAYFGGLNWIIENLDVKSLELLFVSLPPHWQQNPSFKVLYRPLLSRLISLGQVKYLDLLIHGFSLEKWDLVYLFETLFASKIELSPENNSFLQEVEVQTAFLDAIVKNQTLSMDISYIEAITPNMLINYLHYQAYQLKTIANYLKQRHPKYGELIAEFVIEEISFFSQQNLAHITLDEILNFDDWGSCPPERRNQLIFAAITIPGLFPAKLIVTHFSSEDSATIIKSFLDLFLSTKRLLSRDIVNTLIQIIPKNKTFTKILWKTIPSWRKNRLIFDQESTLLQKGVFSSLSFFEKIGIFFT